MTTEPTATCTMFPTIHSNGTSREALLDQVCEAGQKLRDALAALVEAMPHGRDYYPQGNGALDRAVVEHQRRIDAVRGVLSDMVTLSMHIAE